MLLTKPDESLAGLTFPLKVPSHLGAFHRSQPCCYPTLMSVINCISPDEEVPLLPKWSPRGELGESCPVPQTTPVGTWGKDHSVTSFTPLKGAVSILVHFLTDVVLISST